MIATVTVLLVACARGSESAPASDAPATSTVTSLASDPPTSDAPATDLPATSTVTSLASDPPATDASATSTVTSLASDPPASDALATNGGPTTATPTTKVVRTRVKDVDPVRPEGVSTVTVRVTSASGDLCDVCMWLADARAERSRGLMGVTDLGDAVGMVFVWESETFSTFHMTGTPTPLSIAWFDPAGAHVSQLDMEPCLDLQSADCERYSAAGGYTLAIEMFQGELDAIGIGPGSSAVVLPETESATCVAG